MADERPLTESGEIKVHRIPELQAATEELKSKIEEIRGTIEQNKSGMLDQINELKGHMISTDGQLGTTNTLLTRIGLKMSMLSMFLVVAALMTSAAGGLSFYAIWMTVHSNRDKLDDMEVRERAEQLLEDARNAETP